MKKSLVVLLVAVVALGAGLFWWLGRGSADPNELVLQGNVDIRQIALAFDGSGRISALHADEGDAVKAGTLLAVLDTRALALQAERARAEIGAQREVLARLRNGARPQELSQARSRLAAADADAARARQDLARLQNVANITGGRGVSASDLDRAQTEVKVTAARVAEQRDALRLTELGSRAEDVSGAEAQLQAAQAQLGLLEFQIAQGELKAPTNAVVRSRLMEPGDMATPQRPVFQLALTERKWVRVFVGEADLGRISPGMAARIFTDSQPDRPIEGKVGFISSVAEFTPKSVQTEDLRTNLVYEVRVVTDDAGDALRLGQPATVRIAIGKAG